MKIGEDGAIRIAQGNSTPSFTNDSQGQISPNDLLNIGGDEMDFGEFNIFKKYGSRRWRTFKIWCENLKQIVTSISLRASQEASLVNRMRKCWHYGSIRRRGHVEIQRVFRKSRLYASRCRWAPKRISIGTGLKQVTVVLLIPSPSCLCWWKMSLDNSSDSFKPFLLI